MLTTRERDQEGTPFGLPLKDCCVDLCLPLVRNGPEGTGAHQRRLCIAGTEVIYIKGHYGNTCWLPCKSCLVSGSAYSKIDSSRRKAHCLPGQPPQRKSEHHLIFLGGLE